MRNVFLLFTILVAVTLAKDAGVTPLKKLKNDLDAVKDAKNTPIICHLCEFIAKELSRLVSQEFVYRRAAQLAVAFCKKFKLYTDRVCEEVTGTMVKSFWHAGAVLLLDTDRVCPLVANCKPTKRYIDVDEYAKQVISSRPEEDESTFTFIHASDFHVDFKYQAVSY